MNSFTHCRHINLAVEQQLRKALPIVLPNLFQPIAQITLRNVQVSGLKVQLFTLDMPLLK
jgi:hypothetical protein